MTDNVIETADPINEPQGVDNIAPVETAAPVEDAASFDFVLDKYRADGRTDEAAAFEQAKAYGELQKRFGGFTGAPDDYELSINEVAQEMGADIDQDAPIFSEMAEVAKELNMSNDAFNKFSEVMIKNSLAEKQAYEDNLDSEIKSLHNGTARLEHVNGFINANLSPEAAEAFQAMPQTAAQIEAIEQIIGLVKGGSNAPVESSTMSISDDELNTMRMATDEHGNRKLGIDPEFRREYERKMALKHGTQPYRQQIG